MMDNGEIDLPWRRIDCPIDWCTGSLLDHGGDGAEPEHWVHADDGLDVVHGAALYRFQVGGEASTWELVLGGQVVARGKNLQLLGERLRDVAAAVEEIHDLSARGPRLSLRQRA